MLDVTLSFLFPGVEKQGPCGPCAGDSKASPLPGRASPNRPSAIARGRWRAEGARRAAPKRRGPPGLARLEVRAASMPLSNGTPRLSSSLFRQCPFFGPDPHRTRMRRRRIESAPTSFDQPFAERILQPQNQVFEIHRTQQKAERLPTTRAGPMLNVVCLN